MTTNPTPPSGSTATPPSPPRGGPLSGALGLVIAVALFAGAGYMVYTTLFNPGPPTPEPQEMTFLCAKTNKTFSYALKQGESWPIASPYAPDVKTGYPAEACYWTRDNKVKPEPTWIILNEHLGRKGDTICPDCGRVVLPHNPQPPKDAPSAGPTTASQPAPRPGPPTNRPAT